MVDIVIVEAAPGDASGPARAVLRATGGTPVHTVADALAAAASPAAQQLLAIIDTATVPVVLYVDPSRSSCGACGQPANPDEWQHDTIPPGPTNQPFREGCHARFTRLSSHHAGEEIRRAAQRMPPWLPWTPRADEEHPSPPSPPGRVRP